MTKIIYLSLDSIPEEDRQIFEAFTFNPEYKKVTLELNGNYKETIPAITVPITIEQYYDESQSETLYKLENSCVENLQSELYKYSEIGQLDRESILMVFTDDQNTFLILESIKDFHRENLNQESTYSSEGSDPDYGKIISVSRALRTKEGIRHVQGTIIGVSKLFNMISEFSFNCVNCGGFNEVKLSYPEFDIPSRQSCDKCGKYATNKVKHEFVNAVIVELQDSDTFDDMDRLPVFLFEKDTDQIMVGESVLVIGDIQIQQQNGNKKYFTYLYAQAIKYVDRENYTLSEQDKQNIHEFVQSNNDDGIGTIDKLVEIFDPSIVGYEHVKKGLLISAVNTSYDLTRNERINSLLIGDPGLAKTKLTRRITKLVPNSRHESGQSSTGKSLTAIIDKTDSNIFLRPGPVPLAKGAICAINELGRQSMEDQGQLLDVMEEGEFTKNAFGKNVRIKAPTTIIATANPINNSKWRDSDKVDLTEFPVLEPIQDRFDLKFIFKDKRDLDAIRKFADELTDIEDKKENMELPDHTEFLIKYIQYAKEFHPKLSKEARRMLKEFYIEIASKSFGSPRIHITLPKITKAIARLKLKDIADEEEAKEAMEFYNVMLLSFQKQVIVSQSLRDTAYQECQKLLKDIQNIGAITLDELIKTVCKRNGQLAVYFGYRERSTKLEDNKKVRRVYELLLNHSSIKKVSDHPITLQWFADHPDLPDHVPSNKNNFSDQEQEEEVETVEGFQFGNDGEIHISNAKKDGQQGQQGQEDSTSK